MNPTIDQQDIPPVRLWLGARLSAVEETFMFHQDQGPVPETYRRLKQAFEEAGIEHVVIGALAMAVHGYRRATNDVDVCLRAPDLERFKRELAGRVYQRVEGRSRRFYDPLTQVTFDLLVSGNLAGRRDKNQEIRFPDPAEATVIGGLNTVSLERLIALKLVTWRLKDWADVIALIRENKLDQSFALELPGLVRASFLQCYDQMLDEDRYDLQMDED